MVVQNLQKDTSRPISLINKSCMVSASLGLYMCGFLERSKAFG